MKVNKTFVRHLDGLILKFHFILTQVTNAHTRVSACVYVFVCVFKLTASAVDLKSSWDSPAEVFAPPAVLILLLAFHSVTLSMAPSFH